MKLLVGLGNPGHQYERTRHNAGFLVLDEIAHHFKIAWSGTKFHGEYAKGEIWQEPVVLLKPMTYMNLSGRGVQAALAFYKIVAADLIVLHDDIDVPVGKVKARVGGGHGGHKGIVSIFKETGYEQFHRIKLGVGRPDGGGSDGEIERWVLGRMSEDQIVALQSEMFTEALLRLKNCFKKPDNV